MTKDSLSPPSLDEMKCVQLGRKDLIILSGLDGFPSLVEGFYVRVLMESDEGEPSSGQGVYRIAAITGAKKGEPYSDFDAKHSKTSWYLTVVFPGFSHVFTRTGDKVEMSSISSDCFSQREYDEFVKCHQKKCIPFPNIPFLRLRLEESQGRATRDYSQLTSEEVSEVERQVKDHFVEYPFPSDVSCLSNDQIETIIKEIESLRERTRIAMERGNKCLFCKKVKAEFICYPCGHRVACAACRHLVKGVCPVPDCRKQVDEVFIPFIP